MPSVAGSPARACPVPRGKGSAYRDLQGPKWTGSQVSDPTSNPLSPHSAPAADSDALVPPQTRLACYYPTALLKLFPQPLRNVPPPDIWMANSPTSLQPLITCYLFKTCPHKPIEYSTLPHPYPLTPALHSGFSEPALCFLFSTAFIPFYHIA